MTQAERELMARLFEAYALSIDPDLPVPEHFKITFLAAQKVGIVELSHTLPGPAIPARGRTLAMTAKEARR